MKLRYAAALALIFLTGCGASIDAATRRAEEASRRAQAAAARAEASARQSATSAERLENIAHNAEDDVRRANDAAASALVIWCEMVPPESCCPEDIVENAPLSKWEVLSIGVIYLSKAECEKDIKDYAATGYKEDMKQCSNFTCAVNVSRPLSARCIASDDPRVKDNWDVRLELKNAPWGSGLPRNFRIRTFGLKSEQRPKSRKLRENRGHDRFYDSCLAGQCARNEA